MTLYALKPWYAQRLRPLSDALDSSGVSPDALTAAGVLFAAGGGAVLALAPASPLAAVAVAALVAARLACANMDGTLARRRPPRRSGAVVNELGDRLADLALLAGLAVHLGPLGWALLFATTLPSWCALAVAAAGGARSNAGPMGKTERCALAVLAAATGWYAPLAVVIAVGALLTAAVRLRAAVTA